MSLDRTHPIWIATYAAAFVEAAARVGRATSASHAVRDEDCAQECHARAESVADAAFAVFGRNHE